MAKVYPVMVQAEGGDAAKHYSPEFQSAPEYASGWKAVLIKARQGGRALQGKICLPRYRKATIVHTALRYGHILSGKVPIHRMGARQRLSAFTLRTMTAQACADTKRG